MERRVETHQPKRWVTAEKTAKDPKWETGGINEEGMNSCRGRAAGFRG